MKWKKLNYIKNPINRIIDAPPLVVAPLAAIEIVVILMIDIEEEAEIKEIEAEIKEDTVVEAEGKEVEEKEVGIEETVATVETKNLLKEWTVSNAVEEATALARVVRVAPAVQVAPDHDRAQDSAIETFLWLFISIIMDYKYEIIGITKCTSISQIL